MDFLQNKARMNAAAHCGQGLRMNVRGLCFLVKARSGHNTSRQPTELYGRFLLCQEVFAIFVKKVRVLHEM